MRPSIYIQANLGATYATIQALAADAGTPMPANVQACYLQASKDIDYNMSGDATSGITLQAGAVLHIPNSAQLAQTRIRSAAGAAIAVQTWIQ